MLNKDATRQLLPHLYKNIPHIAVDRIDRFLGDNHLNVASELRQITEARQTKLWLAFYKAEILPAAKRGYFTAEVKISQTQRYFPDMGNAAVYEMAKAKGLYSAKAGKGEGKRLVFSWGKNAPDVGKGQMALELDELTRVARTHRSKNTWARFYNTKLLPRAQIGGTNVEIDGVVIDRIFNFRGHENIVDIAEKKAIACVISGQRRTGAKGKGKGIIYTYQFSWKPISLSDGAILHDTLTGVELLKVAAQAETRFWAHFFQTVLMPAAKKGMTHVTLRQSEVADFFRCIEIVDDDGSVPTSNVTTLAERMGISTCLKRKFASLWLHHEADGSNRYIYDFIFSW